MRPIMVILIAASIVGWAPSAGAGDPLRFCAQVQVLSDLDEQAPPGRPAELSAAEVLDIFFFIRLQGRLSGDYRLDLELYTPNGHLYQVLTSPVTTMSGNAGQEVSIPGYPLPMPVQLLNAVREGKNEFLVATMRLPVAGTAIASSSLFGEWAMQVRVDGTPMTCQKKLRFTLTE